MASSLQIARSLLREGSHVSGDVTIMGVSERLVSSHTDDVLYIHSHPMVLVISGDDMFIICRRSRLPRFVLSRVSCPPNHEVKTVSYIQDHKLPVGYMSVAISLQALISSSSPYELLMTDQMLATVSGKFGTNYLSLPGAKRAFTEIEISRSPGCANVRRVAHSPLRIVPTASYIHPNISAEWKGRDYELKESEVFDFNSLPDVDADRALIMAAWPLILYYRWSPHFRSRPSLMSDGQFITTVYGCQTCAVRIEVNRRLAKMNSVPSACKHDIANCIMRGVESLRTCARRLGVPVACTCQKPTMPPLCTPPLHVMSPFLG